jgi:hypothetical protein
MGGPGFSLSASVSSVFSVTVRNATIAELDQIGPMALPFACFYRYRRRVTTLPKNVLQILKAMQASSEGVAQTLSEKCP